MYISFCFQNSTLLLCFLKITSIQGQRYFQKNKAFIALFDCSCQLKVLSKGNDSFDKIDNFSTLLFHSEKFVFIHQKPLPALSDLVHASSLIPKYFEDNILSILKTVLKVKILTVSFLKKPPKKALKARFSDIY